MEEFIFQLTDTAIAQSMCLVSQKMSNFLGLLSFFFSNFLGLVIEEEQEDIIYQFFKDKMSNILKLLILF